MSMHFNITGCGGIGPLLNDRCNSFGDDIDNYLKPTIILFYTLGFVIVCVGVCKLGIPITKVVKRRFKKKNPELQILCRYDGSTTIQSSRTQRKKRSFTWNKGLTIAGFICCGILGIMIGDFISKIDQTFNPDNCANFSNGTVKFCDQAINEILNNLFPHR